MKSLSSKIICILISIIAVIATIARVLVDYFFMSTNDKFLGSAFFFWTILSLGITALIVFALFINYMIVKRIKEVNESTKMVAEGNFSVSLSSISNDEIGELINNFNAMVKELQANEYLNKEFVKNISHEFKTPLSSIKGYAELMLVEESESEKIRYCSIIIKEAERLTNLSKNILQISLLDSSAIIKKEDSYRVDEQIRNILQLMQLEWETKNIEFDLDLDKVFITSNKELTYHIWQNLISNAIKFSPIDSIIGINLHISDKLYFNISNSGTTISEQDKEKVFKQFYIADKSRNKSGSGLGLSITKKIVERLGGSIDFTSEDDVTCFFVELDLAI